MEETREVIYSDEFDPEPSIWDIFKEAIKALESLDTNEVKDFIKNNMKRDIEELSDQFDKDFKHIDDSDPLKTEIMILLGRLGVTFYK